ncbi:MAG TPA: glycosyltransferase family 2 protein [Herpetosiphon sp.]|uniref:dolichyl-phosphate beta-glucosyltransferase n=1 Tax=Herpetosiphon aurantiacus (strain ATCC 23779 / DSM 785 / 114-95) TaxID=316274 RepID=A9AXJ5_HERA2|nr:dolichyl-phosphate beta-glucosyltransferase [Herpetosiphon sp.]ABX03409.1 glycosyl transferase family 2 [Herpetosiphon aurantiacus DSM 785]HBW48801.1 glycosyltransferase family 2 protein [Herpetosiphon sp.]
MLQPTPTNAQTASGQDPDLSVIIPCFNEQKRIIPTINTIIDYLNSLGRSWELIVSDDGSSDQTISLVEAQRYPNLTIIKSTRNYGKGHAVRAGIIAARGNFILFTDADNATPITELDTMLPLLELGSYDIAIGSRAKQLLQTKQRSLGRCMMSAGLRVIVEHGLKLNIHDSQCGFKLFHRTVAKHLAQVQTINSFAFDLELLVIADIFGYQTIEIPVDWVDIAGSKVHPIRDAYQFLRDIMSIQINHWRGRYPSSLPKTPKSKSPQSNHWFA